MLLDRRLDRRDTRRVSPTVLSPTSFCTPEGDSIPRRGYINLDTGIIGRSWGGFVNRDPIGYLGGMNLYAYVGGMPTRVVDPWGLVRCAWSCFSVPETCGREWTAIRLLQGL